MNREQQIIELALTQARRLREQFGVPQVIALSVYATDADLRQLRPEDGPTATAAQQRRMADTVANSLRSDGHFVKLVTLRIVDYLAWLSQHGKPNTPATRAEWTTYQIR